MEGRGLFYSESDPRGHRRLFTKETFDAACKQAKSYGMSFIHIPVADGPNIWYPVEDLQTFSVIAQQNELRCFPTHYCYGDSAGSSVTLEARMSSLLGQIFGGVCPTMGREWERVGSNKQSLAAVWANEYGKQVRASFRGPLAPMLFADPVNHPNFPYLELFPWISGWMPMVYAEVWGKKTATELLLTLESQWSALSRQFSTRYGYFPPVQPIIEIGETPPLEEILTWMKKIQGYGYCGFWCDYTYGPHASYILAAPTPSLESPVAQIPPPVTPIPASPIPMISLGMEQGISDEDLAACYSNDETLVPDLTSPLVTLWAKLTQKGYGIGKVTGPIETLTRQGKEYTILPCEGGTIWYNSREQRTWVQHTTHVRVPGALPSPVKEPEPVVAEPVAEVTVPS